MTCKAAHHTDTMGHCCYSADSRSHLTLDARANTDTVIISTAKGVRRASDCCRVSRTSCCETNKTGWRKCATMLKHESLFLLQEERNFHFHVAVELKCFVARWARLLPQWRTVMNWGSARVTFLSTDEARRGSYSLLDNRRWIVSISYRYIHIVLQKTHRNFKKPICKLSQRPTNNGFIIIINIITIHSLSKWFSIDFI